MRTKFRDRTYTILNNHNIFQIIHDRINAEINASTIVVPHVCNNVNGFGAGFAGQVAEKFPEVKANFHMLGNTAKLGTVQYVTANITGKDKNKIIFANMIAQNGIISRSNPRPLNYAALAYCMSDVKSFIKQYYLKHEIDKIEIHAPKFGSGLAGGNWNFISDLIDDVWSDLNVIVYNYRKS